MPASAAEEQRQQRRQQRHLVVFSARFYHRRAAAAAIIISPRSPFLCSPRSHRYVLLECESLCDIGSKSGRTSTVNGGGKEPKWGVKKKKKGGKKPKAKKGEPEKSFVVDESEYEPQGEKVTMTLCDHAEMKLSVFDDDVGKDDLIGTAELPLKAMYEWAVVDRDKWDEQEKKRLEALDKEGFGDDVKVGRWIPILTKGGKEGGQILVEISFQIVMSGNRNTGAKCLDYPQGRAGIEGLCLWNLKEKCVQQASAGAQASVTEWGATLPAAGGPSLPS